MNKFTDKYKTELENFEYMSQAVGGRNDYIQGGGGNTSVKLDGHLMAIKASGYCLSDIRTDKGFAVLDYASLRRFYLDNQPEKFDDVEKAGSEKAKLSTQTIEGMAQVRPSVEAGFHSILRKYVVHSHSVYANMATCAAECQAIALRALADASYTWGFVSYTDPGARLTFSIRDELSRVEAQTGEVPTVLLMGNHGLIVHHDDHLEALRIHEEVNERIAQVFRITGHDFPAVSVRQNTDGLLSVDAPYLKSHLKSGRYGIKELCEQALYPDQLVFLTGAFFIRDGSEKPAPGTCVANIDSGAVVCNMNQSMAQTIAETLTAIIFIRENIIQNDYTISAMGEAAKTFIANWESEKYRKSLAGK
jgi:rhamnose utilization protein RhaD (predicted bifunctional aldolase and dehydrogenase)